MLPRVTIPAFDEFLQRQGLRCEAVAIGGAALNLLGIVTRETRDLDVLSPALDERILLAAKAFATERRAAGDMLRDDWLNNGPASLTSTLPKDWEQRLQPLFAGAALRLQSLGRSDLLKTKLFAYCDRRTDLGDCLALAPTSEELRDALEWVQYQDANELWPAHVEAMFAALAKRLGHGL